MRKNRKLLIAFATQLLLLATTFSLQSQEEAGRNRAYGLLRYLFACFGCKPILFSTSRAIRQKFGRGGWSSIHI
jgi:hypothetical protein